MKRCPILDGAVFSLRSRAPALQARVWRRPFPTPQLPHPSFFVRSIELDFGMARKLPTVSSIDVRLLDTAIDNFGRKGIDGASTRAMATAAGTTMSSITYHYGGKEGLYLAAARHIADLMGERMAPALVASEARSRKGRGPDAALAQLLAIIDRFVDVMVHPESAAWARFIVREQMEPTEAFDVLYDGVMGRLVDRLSSLIVCIGADRYDAAEARLKVLAIVGQALVFRVARATLLRATGWNDIDAGGGAAIRQIIRAHTIAILTNNCGDRLP
jgi:TetR/AcrR family transcriptional regulator, regulator of cefoperazone and chloramphenicol sensitivity